MSYQVRHNSHLSNFVTEYTPENYKIVPISGVEKEGRNKIGAD